MFLWNRLWPGTRFLAFTLIFLGHSSPVHAYIDLAATLPRIISDSQKIAVVEVVDLKKEKRGLVLKEVRALKGDLSTELIRHVIASGEGGTIPRQILTWATPGARAVIFSSRNNALICLGEGWYQVTSSGTGPWQLAKDRPDLPLAFHGSLSRLAEGLERMLAGKDAVLTVVGHGIDNEGASFDLALNRPNLPGLVRVQRIRGNMNMPAMVMAATANGSYSIGPGSVDEEDLPALLAKLKSPDADIKAAAADDLRALGLKARKASESLTPLLKDQSARVRCSAAAALLQINPRDSQPVTILAHGLASADKTEQRLAIRAIGLSGAAAAPLVDKLAAFLKDEDEAFRISALQALALLGPAAGNAVGAVTSLLDNRELSVDAADALGRIGSAARPSLKRLAQLLVDKETSFQWAAVRAMSQIGGDDAKPAVDYMIRIMPKAPEMDRYNMMIYLALLGPVAKDAVASIRTSGSRNPILPTATIWAIEPEKSFPWQGGGRFGPGFGGPPGGFGGGKGDIATLIYENYVHELGERLKPAVRVLAKQIVEGTAGDIPPWGYKILSCSPETAIEILKPSLADKELVMRERATVALGYMGATAKPALESLKAALAATTNEKEKRLIGWSLREIGKE
jgi:HEAT repeat protein